MRSTIKCLFSLAVFVAAYTSAPALAGVPVQTVGANFAGVNPAVEIEFRIGDGTQPWVRATAGVYRFNRSMSNPGSYPDLQGSFFAFCIELTQPAEGFTTYEVNDITQAVNPTDPLVGPGGTIPLSKKNLLQELWGRFFSDSVLTDHVMAAAFQISVWEIVYDDGLMVGPGGDASNVVAFRPRAGVPLNQQRGEEAVALAQSWLNQLDGSGPRVPLLALTNPDKQDLLFLPAPSALALLTLSGLAATRRRRHA